MLLPRPNLAQAKPPRLPSPSCKGSTSQWRKPRLLCSLRPENWHSRYLSTPVLKLDIVNPCLNSVFPSQIMKVIMSLGDYQGVDCHACIGGTNMKVEMNLLSYKSPHVIVGTPGRVFDMISRQVLGITGCYFVIRRLTWHRSDTRQKPLLLAAVTNLIESSRSNGD